MKRSIWFIILAFSLIVAIVASVNIYLLNKEYQAGINTYTNLEQYVVVEEASEQEPIIGAEEPETIQEEEKKESIIPVHLSIDFAKLKEINDHLVGWLYYEPLEISYPIVRGNDND